MRVLWLIKGLGPGGAERLLALAARDHDRRAVMPRVAYLLAHKRTLVPALEASGVEVSCLDARGPWDIRWLLRLRRLLAAGECDVVHVHSPVVAIGTRLVLRTLPRARRPALVTTEHNVWPSHARLTRLADDLTARGDEIHLAVSDAVRSSMPARLHTRTRVIQYGIDLAAVRAAAAPRADARRALDLPDEALVVGTVANLRATKGYPDLMAAAVTVCARVERARFVTIGQGPLAHDLEVLRDELGLGDRFSLLGYREDALAAMPAFDVFCLASRHEGLPIALMEALALGLPVVATTAGGINELVTDGCEGTLVPTEQPARLAAALIALLEDPARRAAMSEQATRRGDALDIADALRQIEAVYQEVGDR